MCQSVCADFHDGHRRHRVSHRLLRAELAKDRFAPRAATADEDDNQPVASGNEVVKAHAAAVGNRDRYRRQMSAAVRLQEGNGRVQAVGLVLDRKKRDGYRHRATHEHARSEETPRWR
jgi:hypothetical protein